MCVHLDGWEKGRLVQSMYRRGNSRTIRANKHLIKAWKTEQSFFSIEVFRFPASCKRVHFAYIVAIDLTYLTLRLSISFCHEERLSLSLSLFLLEMIVWLMAINKCFVGLSSTRFIFMCCTALDSPARVLYLLLSNFVVMLRRGNLGETVVVMVCVCVCMFEYHKSK